ncbi:MAG: histidine--tRNA ligase [Eubacterium sp.]|nr:histidine--tRNA ligase [Eubacterium sp.]
MLTKAPRGTKDILPNQAYKWHFVENKFTAICERYGFEEIRTPMFEHTELFLRGVGDTTDIVQKEMYTFEDHGNRSITLKPEGTSPAARAFLESKQYAESQPTKYYYETPCFRYEKPQSGRLREFHQFGVEIFGSNSMLADAEVIAMANDFLRDLGIQNIELNINSVGCPSCREVYRKALQEFLKPNYDNLCDTCKDRYERNPMRILDCKSPSCREITKDAPMMIEYLCDDCKNSFEEVKKYLKASEIEYKVDPKIVRGLDYYTKTAFEFVSNDIGAQGTICGGGRYDNLISEVGDIDMPGVGFGLGVERLLLLMDSLKIEIPKPQKNTVLVAVMGEKAKLYGLKLMHDLRRNGVNAQIDLMERNIKGQFKYANKIDAKYTVVIGDNELEELQASVKNMNDSSQRQVKFEDLISELSR